MNVTVHDPDRGHYECEKGTFTDFPLTMRADEAPPVGRVLPVARRRRAHSSPHRQRRHLRRYHPPRPGVDLPTVPGLHVGPLSIRRVLPVAALFRVGELPD